ncbi:hypothetical protein B0H16DRAFT_1661741 [Mycena metata]|uniref:Reverse transcriptase zinc-binding domain-containing protein n=1 Tax=Mycena metata TaxID=1033252 RepID=A0AAD7JJ29_9AGAR|nr:hypothetical protein B0H16DRAFT_1661741 [Mycena metata]
MKAKPHRKSTFINLDRTRCAIQEISGYTPTDATIWKSIRSTNLQRLTREFLWKLGDFWSHIDHLDMMGQCHICRVPESLEHIAVECDAYGQSIVWNLTKQFGDWFWMHLGRLFAILVSIAWHLIWKLRVDRVMVNPNMPLNKDAIHNQWLKMVNAGLQRDRILTNKRRFGTLALKKQIVLNTWSGLLMDENSLPDDWISTRGF